MKSEEKTQISFGLWVIHTSTVKRLHECIFQFTYDVPIFRQFPFTFKFHSDMALNVNVCAFIGFPYRNFLVASILWIYVNSSTLTSFNCSDKHRLFVSSIARTFTSIFKYFMIEINRYPFVRTKWTCEHCVCVCVGKIMDVYRCLNQTKL